MVHNFLTLKKMSSVMTMRHHTTRADSKFTQTHSGVTDTQTQDPLQYSWTLPNSIRLNIIWTWVLGRVLVTRNLINLWDVYSKACSVIYTTVTLHCFHPALLSHMIFLPHSLYWLFIQIPFKYLLLCIFKGVVLPGYQIQFVLLRPLHRLLKYIKRASSVL